MKHNIKALAVLFAAPLIATTGLADDGLERPSYNFVELDYIYASLDVSSDALPAQANADTWYLPEGFALRGSTVLFEQLLLRASYYDGQGEWKSTRDTEASTIAASVGWLIPTTDSTGIDFSLEYRDDELEFEQPNKWKEDVDGLGVSFGVRATPLKNTEFGLRVGWYEGDFNGAIGFNLNGAWNFSEHWGVNASWEYFDSDVRATELESYELNQYGLGVRYYW